MKLPAIRFYLLVVAGGFAALVGARSEDGNRPSEKLLGAIADIKSRFPDANATNVLSLLAEPPKSWNEPAKLRYDLAAADYEFVLNKTLDTLNDASEREIEKLLGSGLLWIDLIRRFKLEGTTKRIAQLLDSEKSYVQGLAFQMLAALDARQYESDVAKLLSTAPNGFQREIRRVLLDWNSKELIPFFIRELNDEDKIRRYEAITGLGKIGDQSVIPALLKCGSDSSEENRIWALRAARTLIPLEERTKLLVPLAREIAGNASKADRVDEALAVSIDSGDVEAVPAVIARLTSKDLATRSIMATALWDMSVTTLAEAASASLLVREPYGDPATNEDVRTRLIAILSRAATPNVVPALRFAATDSSPLIQGEAISVLGQIRAKEAIEDLARALVGPSAREAAVALAQMRDRRALDKLKPYLQEPNSVDSHLLYSFKRGYSPEFYLSLETTQLNAPIDAPPDEILTILAKEYGVMVKLHMNEQEWAKTATRAGKVRLDAGVLLDESIGRALRCLGDKYHAIPCRNELHMMKLNEAPQFIIEMLEADLR